MIEEVELSRSVIETDKKVCRLLGEQPLPYLYHLGYVIGTINGGLTYASPPC